MAARGQPGEHRGGEPADLVGDLLPGHCAFLPLFVQRGVQRGDVPAEMSIWRRVRQELIGRGRRGMIRYEALRRPVEPQQHRQDNVALATTSVPRSGHARDTDRMQHWPRIRPVDLPRYPGPRQPPTHPPLIKRRIKRGHIKVTQSAIRHATHFLRTTSTQECVRKALLAGKGSSPDPPLTPAMIHVKQQICNSTQSYEPTTSRMLTTNASTSDSVVSKAAIQRTVSSRSSQVWKVQSRWRVAMCLGSRRAKTPLAWTG
jgi:hypothetical protein